jgi:hypothetical protein
LADNSIPLKGVAFDLGFSLYKSDGSVIADPGTYTKKVWKDGGGPNDITGNVTETDTTYGVLVVPLSATEMNADRVQVYVKDDTAGCVPFTATLYPAAVATVAALLDHAISGHTGAGSVGALLNLITDIDGETDRIKEGGDLDAIIDVIKTSTDRLTSARAGYIDLLPDIDAETDMLKATGELHLAIEALAAAIGTPANTGGTASLAAILGNPANSSVAARLTDIDSEVDALHTATGGAGAITWTYTLTEADATPIADADVWACTDSAGSNVVASGRTNNSGVVTFLLDPGTYYLFAQKAGWNFVLGDPEVVAAP